MNWTNTVGLRMPRVAREADAAVEVLMGHYRRTAYIIRDSVGRIS